MSRPYVIIFDWNIAAEDNEYRRSRVEAEARARADGYSIHSDDGTGLLTYVIVDTVEEAIHFKLKYL